MIKRGLIAFFCFFTVLLWGEEQIVIIGDSISDSGNSLAAPISPSFIFPRLIPLTDGSTWPVVLANNLDAKRLLPSISGGTNFAYIAALAVGRPPDNQFHFSNPSLLEQVSFIPNNVSRKSPVFAFGGSNNIFFLSGDPQTIGSEAAVGMGQVLKAIRHKRFKNIVIFNQPDLGLLPSAGAFKNDYTVASLAFNSTLQNQLKKLKFPVLQLDMFSLFNSLIADPAKYGFLSADYAKPPALQVLEPVPGTCFSENCFQGPCNAVCTNCVELFNVTIPLPPPLAPIFVQALDYCFGTTTAGYPFWYDGTHPTQYAHDIIADYVYSIITAPECFVRLAQLPASILREQNTNIRQQLYPLQPVHLQKNPYLFINGDYSPKEQPQVNCCKYDANGGAFTVGITDQINKSWTMGAAYSYNDNGSECKIGNNKCEFGLKANTLSIFTGIQGSNGYINAIFNAAWIDFNDINRKFFTGPAAHHAKAETDGQDYSGYVYGAYFLKLLSCISTGPIVDINYQHISVDGYKESGADIGNLAFKDFRNEILSTGLGWEFQLNNALKSCTIVTDIFVTANRQWLSHTKHVHLREKSLPGKWGAWPVELPSNNYASGGVNLSIGSSRIIGSLGYTFNVGSHDMAEHFLTAGLTFPLSKH